jgi:hypothetical protein
MGRYTIQVWVCDWCEVQHENDAGDYPPFDWQKPDWNHNTLLCWDCFQVSENATKQAKASRLGVQKNVYIRKNSNE